MKLSVLMSVYEKDSPPFLQTALGSIWDEQTIKPDELVIVQDGPLTTALTDILTDWETRLGKDILRIVSLPENVGTGVALNAGLQQCTHELVARMDADDISLPERFQKQIIFMTENPDCAASSAWIEEIDENENKISIRKLPITQKDILKFAKRRNPLSHPVTIYRKSMVLSVGGYPPLRKVQDYALWTLMLNKEMTFGNIPKVLLKMRTGGTMMLARRGRSYFQYEKKVMKMQKDCGFISPIEYYSNLFLRGLVRLTPVWIKTLLYRYGR